MCHLRGLCVFGTYDSNVVNKTCSLLFFLLVCKVMWSLCIDYGGNAVEYICTMWQAYLPRGI